MVKRIGSSRRKTRDLMSVPRREKGKLAIRKILQTFEIDEKVALNVEPKIASAPVYRRFRSRIGIVKGVQGKVYKVAIHDCGKAKIILVHPAHLKKI